MSRIEDLAGLCDYPDATWAERLAALAPGSASLEQLREKTASLDAGELEELYTKTFDMSPACALDVGWHLFGEAYGRGAFLVEVKTLLKEHGVEAGTELPDHLPTLLRLLGRLDPVRRANFARARVLPALEPLERALHTLGSPYVHLMEAVRAALGEPDVVPVATGEA